MLSQRKSAYAKFGGFQPQIFCFTKDGETINEDDLAIERGRVYEWKIEKKAYRLKANPPEKLPDGLRYSIR